MQIRPRLLERIRVLDPNWQRRESDDESQLRMSVRRNILNMLGTRQGNTLLDEEIGLPDYSVMTMNFSEINRAELESQIVRIIEKFEPRLANLRVTFIGAKDPIEGVHFRIEGTIGDEHPVPLELDTIVNPSGKIFLRDVQA